MNMSFRPVDGTPMNNGVRSNHTFREAAENYAARKPSQQKYLKTIIEHIGDMYLSDIVPIMIKDLAVKLYPTQTNATRNRGVLGPVKAVFYHGNEYGWCNPIRIRNFKEEGPKERPYATVEWMVLFLKQCRDDNAPHLAALALFMFRTGARISEALRVVWDDVDLLSRKAILRKTKTETNSVRHLTNDLITYMQRLARYDTGRVFRYTCRHSVNERIRIICARAKIRYLSCHALGRRSYAKQTVVLGIDTKSAMVGGGWKSSKVFLDIYVQSPDGGRIVADKFNSQRFDVDIG